VPTVGKLASVCAAVAVLAAAAAPGAAAKQEIGADLGNFIGPVTGNCSTAEFTQFQVGLPSGRERPGGIVQPTIAGVVTTWRIRVESSPQIVLPVSLLTLRQTSPTTYSVTGASPPTNLAPPLSGTATQAIPTRVPIEAGGLIAITNLHSGSNECLYVVDFDASCNGFTDVIVGQPPAAGQTMTSLATPIGHNGCTMINADVEPDADHDGYGDETQDKCATDATTQGACPVAAPCSTLTGKARKRCRCRQKPKKKARKKCLRKLKVAGRRR
jgi:hypothetical protein